MTTPTTEALHDSMSTARSSSIERRAREILRKARDLIAEPDHWMQGDEAADAHGNGVQPHWESAVMWCSIGAISAAVGKIGSGDSDSGWARDVAAEFLARAIQSDEYSMSADPDDIIVTFNDHSGRTHDEILEAFDKAINL